jgi:hypothetical protein
LVDDWAKLVLLARVLARGYARNALATEIALVPKGQSDTVLIDAVYGGLHSVKGEPSEARVGVSYAIEHIERSVPHDVVVNCALVTLFVEAAERKHVVGMPRPKGARAEGKPDVHNSIRRAIRALQKSVFGNANSIAVPSSPSRVIGSGGGIAQACWVLMNQRFG